MELDHAKAVLENFKQFDKVLKTEMEVVTSTYDLGSSDMDKLKPAVDAVARALNESGVRGGHKHFLVLMAGANALLERGIKDLEEYIAKAEAPAQGEWSAGGGEFGQFVNALFGKHSPIFKRFGKG